MYPSTSSGSRDTARQPNVKTCGLCLNECDEINIREYNSKLPNLCCKFLHSSFTKELTSLPENHSLCTKCFVSAMELIVLSEQMEFVQKSISELVFIFSLDILHRKGKTTNSGKKLAEFDVSTLPNSNSWNIPTSIYDESTPIATPEITDRDINVVENVDPLLIPDQTENEIIEEVSVDGIKCENALQLWIEEGTMETENPLGAEDTTPLNTHIMTPMLQIPKLKLESDGRKILVEEMNTENRRFTEVQDISSVWTKSDSGTSYKNTQQNPTPSESTLPNWDRTPMLPSFNPSLAGPITFPNDTTLHFSEMPIAIEQNFSSSSLIEPTNEISIRKAFKSRRFKPRSQKSGLIRREKEKAYSCSICKKSFDQPASLKFHQKLQHRKEQPFKCSHCGKGFILKWDLIRHVRTHTGEKPFKCDKCDYAAALHVGLQSHIRNHHSDSRPYKCKECENVFITTKSVESHFKRVHFGLEFSENSYCYVNSRK